VVFTVDGIGAMVLTFWDVVLDVLAAGLAVRNDFFEMAMTLSSVMILLSLHLVIEHLQCQSL
jgi:hypothetical protein